MFTSYLLPFIKVFHDNYPNVKLNIKYKSTYEIVDLPKDGKLDFGIIDLPIEKYDQFITREMWTVQDCFICSEKYKFLLEKSILYKIKTVEEIPPRKVGIITLKDVEFSTAAMKFIDYL